MRFFWGNSMEVWDPYVRGGFCILFSCCRGSGAAFGVRAWGRERAPSVTCVGAGSGRMLRAPALVPAGLGRVRPSRKFSIMLN